MRKRSIIAKELRFRTKVYYDYGDGFSEEFSDVIKGYVKSKTMHFELIIPKGCLVFRWDPSERDCCISEIFVRDENGGVLPILFHNGTTVLDGIIFSHNDSALCFDVKNVRKILISACITVFNKNDTLYQGYGMLLRDNQMLREQIQESTPRIYQKRKIKISEFEHENREYTDEMYRLQYAILKEIYTKPRDFNEFVPYRVHNIKFSQDDVKPIAYYLPQFHAIPENDTWWGRGFTEWTNVAKATALFPGHRQPQLPIDLGFYDLNRIEVMERQIELAKNYGIFGFCFYYYWFGGRRLLEKPIESFLSNPDRLNMPFCLCWANENWTRRWDGQEDEILMQQDYSVEDDNNCINDIARFLKDERYICIDGKPLIIIYRGNLIPDLKGTIARWKAYCKEIGIGEIIVAGISTDTVKDPVSFGFDLGVEFPPNGFLQMPERTEYGVVPSSDINYNIYNISDIIDHVKASPKILKGVFTNWDNTPRRRQNANVFQQSPKQYAEWLRRVIEITKESQGSKSRYIFINAWNEWAEGAHLEPDQRMGYAYLEATASILEKMKN